MKPRTSTALGKMLLFLYALPDVVIIIVIVIYHY